jgi:hypothetical protein
MTCEQVRLSLGAYALGSLDADEDAEVRAHVEDCPACQEELDEFEGLPALLAELTIEEASGRVQPSPSMYEALLVRAAAEDAAAHPRHRFLTLAAAAGVAVLALVGGTLGWQQLRSGPPEFRGHQGAVHLAVQLESRATGTALTVKVRGLPAHEHCELVAVGADGANEDAGWWVANYEGEATVTGMTAMSVPDLTKILVLDENGKQLVSTKV